MRFGTVFLGLIHCEFTFSLIFGIRCVYGDFLLLPCLLNDFRGRIQHQCGAVLG